MILNALNLLQGIFYWLMSMLLGIIAEELIEESCIIQEELNKSFIEI
jgi:hypothetical protein